MTNYKNYSLHSENHLENFHKYLKFSNKVKLRYYQQIYSFLISYHKISSKSFAIIILLIVINV